MRRWLLCGVALVGFGFEASAADMPDILRGSSTVIAAPGGTRWDSFYVGGHVGWSVPGIDYTNNTAYVAPLITGATSATSSPLGTQDSTSKHFGGFVGYQQQWDGAVVGIEGNYNWLDKSLTATNTIIGALNSPPGSSFTYSAVGSVTSRMIDYGTLRVRGGWAYGSFMPYATFGLAVGRMDIDRSVLVTPGAAAGSLAAAPAPFTVTETRTNQFGYGYAAGVGLDFCLISNLFGRVEYEYVQFPDFQGLNAHLHNVRVGAAYKF